MAQGNEDKLLTRLLRKTKVKIPTIAFQQKSPDLVICRPPISRKILQAYLDIKVGPSDQSFQKPISRCLSYSKLLQETPDAFRMQHSNRKLSDRLIKQPPKQLSSLHGVQGVKSVIGGKRMMETLSRKIERRPVIKKKAPRTMEKGLDCSLEIPCIPDFDPDTIDISPEIYLKEPRLQRNSDISDLFPKHEYPTPWSFHQTNC